MRALPIQRVILPVLSASAALVLAGCGDDGGSTEAGDDSPLAEFFGEGVIEFSPGGGMGMSFGGSSDFEIPEDELRRMREVEDLVAKCMADEGFEYTANAINPEEWVSPWMDAQELPPDEFAEEYGYGISTLHYSQFEDELPQDPNQEYRESLSPEARDAYERALSGDYMSWEADEGPPPVEERGCYGIASAEVYGEDPLEEMEQADPWTEFDGLMNDLSSLSERIHTDPRLEEAAEAWLDCMADAGYPDFQQVGDAEQSVHERMNEIEGWAEVETTLEEGGEEANREVLEEFEPKEPDPQELAELQEHEIELAVADRECMAEHYDDVFAGVSDELEEEFVEEHRAELERYREWAEENDFDGGFGFGFGSAVG
jgi:hypothetical protein